VGAMNTRSQAREDEAVNRAMLERRGYDLIVFATGANDVFTLDVTPGHLTDLIERHRRALPNAPILLLTPADRGKHKTFPQTALAVAQRLEIAEKNQVAGWDLFEAMGGRDSMGAFKKRGFAMGDYVHFNQAGGGYMGDRLVFALFSALWDHLEAHPNLGCESSSREKE
jgi:lysophospholipase L1-like esterase